MEYSLISVKTVSNQLIQRFFLPNFVVFISIASLNHNNCDIFFIFFLIGLFSSDIISKFK